MKFNELLDRVNSTTGTDWVRVDNGPDLALNSAVLRNDVAISMEWGREHDTGGPWTEAWSEESFPSATTLHGIYVDLRYNGVTVKTDLVVGVDGDRAYLPTGISITEGRRIVGQRVHPSQVVLARIVHELTSSESADFGWYCTTANIKVTGG